MKADDIAAITTAGVPRNACRADMPAFSHFVAAMIALIGFWPMMAT